MTTPDTSFDSTTLNPAASIVPHHREAEEAVIGSLIINPDIFHECRLQLPEGGEEFYIHRNRWIWNAAETVVTSGKPLDILVLSEQLERDGYLAEIGGSSYLTSLINQTPSSLNAATYAEIIHDRHVRRRMITAANQTAGFAYDLSKTTEEAGGEATRALSLAVSLNNQKSVTSMSAGLLIVDKMIEDNGKLEDLPGILTPWVDYNKLLGGGAQKTDLNLIVGRPGKGKTTVLMQIAYHAAKYGEGMRIKRHHVVFFSLEMPVEQLIIRLIATISGIDYQVVRSGHFNEVQEQRYIAALEELDQLTITFVCKSGSSPAFIRSTCELLAAKGELDLICVDSLDRMKAGGSFKGREFAEADECAKGLKDIALDFDVPIWAAHQMNRDIEKRGDDSKPKLSDMRDGGEQPANGVMFIWHEMDDKTVKRSWFIQEKNRNGPVGEVPVTWIPATTRFENYARGS